MQTYLLLTVYGKIGIKVWICKGEVLGKRELNPNFVGGKDAGGPQVEKRRDDRGGDDRGGFRGGDRRDNRGGGGGDRRDNRGGGGWWKEIEDNCQLERKVEIIN